MAAPAWAELQDYDPGLQLAFDVVAGDAVQAGEPPGEYNFPLWFRDAKSMMLRACLDSPGMCLQEFDLDPDADWNQGALFEHEFIYWVAEAQPQPNFDRQPGADDIPRARFILALGGFIAELDPLEADGQEGIIESGVFNAVLVFMRGLQPLTEYTITHPFPPVPVTASTDNRGRLGFEDPELHPAGNPEELFDIALEGPIQHFLYAAPPAGAAPVAPVLPIAENGSFYIGDPTIEAGQTLFGSPYGINYVLVEGPGIPAGGIRADLFTVAGQIYFGAKDNLAPLANLDLAVARPEETVMIDVLANDLMQGDVPINPTSLEYDSAIGAVEGGGTVSPVRNLDQVLLGYTAPATPGLKSFYYTVATFTGEEAIAQVLVFVEDLAFDQADYRVRTGKWTLNGTSNFSDLSFAAGEGLTAYPTALVGGQEVPPVNTSAAGFAVVIIPDSAPVLFDIIVEVDVQPVAPITRAHIHLGETGVNGGRLFDLCGEVGTLPEEGTLECGSMENFIATLTAAEVRAVGDIEAGDFDAAIQAIRDGRTYVNVHTDVNQGGFPAGEIRGQLGRNVIVLKAGEAGPVITAVEVGEDESWSFSGKANLAPAGEEGVVMVEAESSLGQVETRQLRLR